MKLLNSFAVLLSLTSIARADVTSETGALQQSGVYAPIVSYDFYDVGNDNGGVVLDYVLKTQILRNDQTAVRFNGECNSSCTLYLTLPACVTPQASFGFHLPYGSDPKNVSAMKKYIWKQYPRWVRQYINANGGWTNKLVVMPYTYAAKFLPTCPE